MEVGAQLIKQVLIGPLADVATSGTPGAVAGVDEGVPPIRKVKIPVSDRIR